MARRTSLVGGGSGALGALCQRPLSSADFRAALRAPLRGVIEFDAYCANTCDVDTGVVTSSIGDGLSSEQARLLFALEAEGKAAVAGLDRLGVDSGSAHVVPDLVSRARVGAESRATLVRAGAKARCLSAVQLSTQTPVIIDDLKIEAGRTLLAVSAGLTPREREVSACIARGDENLAIAGELGISPHTVKDHIKAILNKTGCSNRTELAARWNGARS